MTILTKSEILGLIQNEGMITGYGNLEEQLQPNGIDLRIDIVNEYKTRGMLFGNSKSLPYSKLMDADVANDYILNHGAYSFSIMETIKLPNNVCAITIQRSSVMRCGCITNIGFWDSGYNGKGESQLIVNNPYGFVIRKGTRIIQMIFLMSGETEGYHGQYQHENVSENK